MNKQAEALKLAEELLADIELSRLGADQCILKGTRLARLVSDDEAQTWLRYELHGYDGSVIGHKYMTETGRWSDSTETTGYVLPLPQLQSMLDGERDKLAALQGSSLAGEYIVIAQRARHEELNATVGRISKLSAIVSGVLVALHDFVMRSYYELLFSEIQAELFASVQSEVDARVAPMAGDALSKIDVISERLRAGDVEAISHAMTTCRRLIDSIADAVCPASEGTVEVDGQQLAATNGHVLNRLSIFAYQRGASKGRRDRLRRSFGDIYGRVSKGVHADVTAMEARFVFLQTYLLLGELLTL